MNYNNLLVTEEDGIIILTINREKALNAINRETMVEIGQFFASDVPNANHIKGVIITGAGTKAFVAGADIKEFMDINGEQGAAMSKVGHDVYFSIERFHKPVIAAVNGFALGGGCELAMACHMRIASEKAKFGQPEVNLGLIPGYGGSQRFVQYIGKGKAIELLLTADMIKADEAKQLGLVNHVVEHGQSVEKAKEIINKIGTKGPIAVAKTIATVNAYFDKNTDGYAMEVAEFGNCMDTEDFREGSTAFVEKRAANFQNK